MVVQIAIAVTIATALAFLARWLRQPLILAYVAAGIIVGPMEGFGWVDVHAIEPISELGLILLLFMIGLEIDLHKLRGSGRALTAAGLGQFAIGVALGLPFFAWLAGDSGRFAPLYLAVSAALSSTMIVVKLLYDKFELDTVPGRITLGVLVFQDIWAILFLALQRDLNNPAAAMVLLSIVKGMGLVTFALLFSRFMLPRLFHAVSKLPEMTVLGALGWCFLVVMSAAWLGLSREMGALIAGISVAAFPYNLEVVARIISLRDFFITLFFVSLGAKIPRPDADLVVSALWTVGFVVATRFLSLTPLLHFFRSGTRVSFIPPLNLSQVSEFSLVICALGVSLGHIEDRVLSIVLLAMVITAVISTYAIQYNHQIYSAARPLLHRVGLKDADEEHPTTPHTHEPRSIFFLGFSRYASSLLQELLQRDPALDARIGVVDFNPQVKRELDRRGIFNLYGDISHTDTLQHAGVQHAEVVLCTIPDAILKGTTNLRLLHKLRAMAPGARILVTAEFFYAARELYENGADFVFVPRLMSVGELADAVIAALDGDISHLKARGQGDVMAREQLEVLP